MTENQRFPHIDIVGPERDNMNRIVHSHAQEIPYNEGANRWQQRIQEIGLMGGDSSHQIVIMPTNDLSKELICSNEYPLANKNPIGIARINLFPDNEDLVTIENEVPGTKHLTIIGSPINYSDLFHIMQVASHYKEILGTEHVTLLAPFLTTTRQDKNVNSKTGGYEPVSINVYTTIAVLSTCVDSFMVTEPHSFATQTIAVRLGRPLFPITPWRHLMDTVLGKEICVDGEHIILTPENTISVRPDNGRNIAATRISNQYSLDHVSFNKKRISPTEVKPELYDEDQKKVAGKYCVVYDDEFDTVRTLDQIATKLGEYGAHGVIAVGVHGKFTGEWERHANNKFIKKIFITDSRQPIGDIKPYINSGKIEIISLKNLICQILKADAKGINFWTNPDFSHMVLQTNGQNENC
jgi:phosphoribosylpyrophosphate synthetase